MFNDGDYSKHVQIKRPFDGNYILYESNGNQDALLNVFEYFEKIKPYLPDLIDFYNTKGEWKVPISMIITFVFGMDTDDTKNV